MSCLGSRQLLGRYHLDASPKSLGILAPANPIDWSATVHRCSRAHANTHCPDAGGYHGPRDGSCDQDDAGPCNAPDGIRNVLAVHDGTGRFTACCHEPGDQQRRECNRKLHFALLVGHRCAAGLAFVNEVGFALVTLRHALSFEFHFAATSWPPNGQPA